MYQKCFFFKTCGTLTGIDLKSVAQEAIANTTRLSKHPLINGQPGRRINAQIKDVLMG